MGASKSKAKAKVAFEVLIITGDVKNLSGDSVLSLVLYDANGHPSDPIPVGLFETDLQPGSQDKQPVCSAEWTKDFGETVRIEFWREKTGQLGSDEGATEWFCDKFIVRDRRKAVSQWKYYYFPVHLWIVPEKHYVIDQLNTSFAEDDPNRDQRDEILGFERAKYTLEQKIAGLPPQIQVVPAEEERSYQAMWDLLSKRQRIVDDRNLIEIYNPPPTMPHVATLASLFVFKQLPAPSCLEALKSAAGASNATLPNGLLNNAVTTTPLNNAVFGAQRVRGANPCAIRVCGKSEFESLLVTSEMLRIDRDLEGWPLEHALDAHRILIADYSTMFEGLPNRSDRAGCSPIAIFFVSSTQQLMPLAIQFGRKSANTSSEGHVFLPTDPPHVWFAAKMWFNVADACYQQLVLHFAYTHLVMEGVYVAMRRSLSVAHPIYQLLAPHLQHLSIVNALSVNQLLAPNGFIEKCYQIGREGGLELIRRALAEFRLDVHGNPHKEIETRGLLDPRVPIGYPYRDDALLVHKSLYSFVMKYVKKYYEPTANQPNRLRNDSELFAFRRALLAPISQGGCEMRGVPGAELETMQSDGSFRIQVDLMGQFRTVEDLALTLTAIIWLCSAQHSAMCNSQYEECGFPLNYSPMLQGTPPTDYIERSPADIARMLPDRKRMMDMMATTYLFGERFESKFGTYDPAFIHEPDALALLDEFKKDLEAASETVKQRNRQRPEVLRYPYLDPEFIHNYITA